MFSKEDFIKFIVDGPEATTANTAKQENAASALPEGFGDFGFDTEEVTGTESIGTSSFAHNLLIASSFGDPEHIERSEVILNTDAAAKHLPDLVYYWPRTDDRPYQTLLFELDQSGTDILKTSLFKPSEKQQLLEDALSRFLQHTLRGFEKGGEKRTASTRRGKQSETMCIVSVHDDRETENGKVNLVCFGTQNASNGSLESFHIREEAKYWEPQLRDDHLSRLYDRHFKNLASEKWQNAFISPEERKLARKLLDTCIDNKVNEHDIEQSVVDLLEEIARSYGLRRKGGKAGKRLKSFALPKDHDIACDSESTLDGKNPFKGMALCDERSRLLGYIIYCLDEKQDAEQLRGYLQDNNRFHNVLVIYPDGDQANLELWQGKTVLSGKLIKSDTQYSGEGEVVNLLSRFFVVSKAKVKNPAELAQELAYRARFLRKLAIKELDDTKEEGPLRDLYKAFKKTLVHDQTEEEFADAFSQTLTYGLLTSRWMGSENLAQTGERFSRQNALKYLPTTSNFLGDLFETSLSLKLNEHRGRLLWLVDDIANLLDRIDVKYIFGAGDKDSDEVTDPVIHFYEPFLAEYDKSLKDKRGVFFTPRPVVSFIVRSVHELLQEKFGLEDGLASSDTWGDIQKRFPNLKLPVGVKEEDPFVCILDPSTGTGTFLYECIGLIEKTMKTKWCSELSIKKWDSYEIIERWREYVNKYLFRRIYGYELMMASYSIAHLKLVFKMAETGYSPKDIEHLNVYLTNSLEQPVKKKALLPGFTSALAKEAQEVSEIKNNIKFTVIVGNPPYAGVSANMSVALDLIEPYKFVDGKPLAERKHWLHDDYVKFIRLAQVIIKRSEIGVIGYITNHGFLDNSTFRGMRQDLMNTFSSIRVLDLNGSVKKKDKKNKNEIDENVFDIEQGVAIGLFHRDPEQQYSAKVYHESLIGSRQEKYKYMEKCVSKYTKIHPSSPYYFFILRNETHREEYDNLQSIKSIFQIFSTGVQTSRDHLVVANSREELVERVERFININKTDDEVRKEFFPNKSVAKYKAGDTRQWDLSDARKILQNDSQWKNLITDCLYRPFDIRQILYSSQMVDWPRPKVMGHMLAGSNRALLLPRQLASEGFYHAFVAKNIAEMCVISTKTKEQNNVFPLYLYSQKEPLGFDFNQNKDPRTPNFNPSFLKTLALQLKIQSSSIEDLLESLSAESIFNYIYSILHSLSYRKRYAEFLKIDFPRIPLPSNIKLFKLLSEIGENLVSLHLLELRKFNFITTFTGLSHPEVKSVGWFNDGIWIDYPANKKGQPRKPGKSGFLGVPEEVWNFQIGGYQVCDKWLKDRKGRLLTTEDIEHYQKIIVVVSETIRFQTEIEDVINKHGGWPNAFVINKGVTP